MINEDGKKQKLYAHLIICLRIFIMKVSDDAVNDEKHKEKLSIQIFNYNKYSYSATLLDSFCISFILYSENDITFYIFWILNKKVTFE